MEDSMLKKLATEMLLTEPTATSSSVPVSLVMEADLADLHTLERWFNFWQLEQVFPHALHFCFLSSGELYWPCFCSPQNLHLLSALPACFC